LSEDTPKTFKWIGLTFDWTTIISTLTAFAVVLALGIYLSRKLSIRPNKKQNLLEFIINFTNGIVKDQIHEEGFKYKAYIFTLFMFVFISNEIGLFLQFGNGSIQVKSPTANPLVTLTLALMSLMVAHMAGVEKYGFIGYLKSYLSPTPALLPINILEQLTSFLTLGMRLYGNIFAGELLLNLVSGMAMPNNTIGSPIGVLGGIVLTLIWQVFSLAIGAIQAYIFATLTSVYISQKITEE
jgi:F-type H+-transporting ATPase subunit a